MPKYGLEIPCATEGCGGVVVHVPVTEEGASGNVTAARSGFVVLELLLQPWTAVLVVMEDVTANVATKKEKALEKEGMLSCGGRRGLCVLEEEKVVLCFLWRCGVDGWVRAIMDSIYGWLDGCFRAESV